MKQSSLIAFVPVLLAATCLAQPDARSFSVDPTDCVLEIAYSGGGDTLGRTHFKIFGDGRVEGSRLRDSGSKPISRWETMVGADALAELEQEILQAKLLDFDEEALRARVAAQGRPLPTPTDAPTAFITFRWLEGSGSTRKEMLRKISIAGGGSYAYAHRDISEFAAILRVLQFVPNEPLPEKNQAHP